MNKPSRHIVLLGIGHTNAHVVKEWASNPIPECTLTCVSKFPTATYSGMLPGTLGGQFHDDEMRIDLQQLVDQAGAKLILADACGLDLETGQIHFSDHDSISFDALSIGVGSIPAGWQQHAESPLMVPIKPMQTFLQRLDKHLKPAGQTLRIAIVGGGVASIEIACCLQQQLGKLQHNTTIEIFTSSDHVADGMTDRSIRRLTKLLTDRHIAIHYNQRVTEVGDTQISTGDGTRYSTDCVIWATGAAAPPVLKKLNLKSDNLGFVATRNTLQSLSDPRIFAVGDSGTIVESPSPKAGVYAVRQCPILWHNLRALLNGGEMKMKKFSPQTDFLKILNTGDGKAFLQYRRFTAHAGWCWKFKKWLDQQFLLDFQIQNKNKNKNSRVTHS